MAIGDSAGLLFRIRADNSQAKRELTETKGLVSGLGSEFSALANPAALATAGIAAIGAAAITGAAAIFNLTKAAAEYGSEIFDATQKTGLGAEALSALRYAAEQSGSSFAAITSSVAKFNVLLGEAKLGNDKAEATLKQYGITATDTNKALEQAIELIGRETDASKQAAIAKALFKDRTGEVLQVIKSFDGNLPSLIAHLRDLGLLMSDEDARAADQFADTLGDLEKQASALGRQFALELMPYMTQAMSAISASMAQNKGEAAKWAEVLIEAAGGVVVLFKAGANEIRVALQLIDSTFGTTAANSVSYAAIMREALISLITPLMVLVQLQRQFGSATSGVKSSVDATVGSISDQLTTAGNQFTMPAVRMPGKAGKAPKDDSAKRQREAEALAMRNLRAQAGGEQNNLQIWGDDVADTLKTMLDTLRDIGTSDEFVNKVGKAFERLDANLNIVLSDLEKYEDQIHANDTEAEKALLKQDQQMRRDAYKDKIDKARQDYKEGVAKINKDNEEAADKRLDDEIRKTKELMELERKRQEFQDSLAHPGVFSSPEAFGISHEQLFPTELMTKGQEMLQQSTDWLTNLPLDVLDRFAQGIGSVVQNLVLMGTAGPNAMKKLTASVLAGIAAQAAVLAIKHFAMGIAALTPWGAAEYGPASAQFLAAAKFGSIAAIAGVAGRAIAGNSFNQQASAATGGGGQGQPQQNNYGTQFQGFGQQLQQQNNRLAEVLGQVEETMHDFKSHFGVASPGDVVMRGAGEASRSIRDAYHSELSNDVGTTEGFYRRAGGAR